VGATSQGYGNLSVEDDVQRTRSASTAAPQQEERTLTAARACVRQPCRNA